MAQSTQRAVSDGTLVSLDLSIHYIDRSEIAVYFDAVLTTAWEWVGETAPQITFSQAVPNGVEVLVKRTTNISRLRHEFSKGAAFTAEVLDEDLTQVLHIAQEASEANLSGQFYSDIDMHNYRIRNIGTAVDDTDALTLGQYKADAIGAFASKIAAAGSATAAASYATTAGTHATNAGNSAAAAANSASAAAGSATAAASYATTAGTHATNAGNSAAAAANSASAAATSATSAACGLFYKADQTTVAFTKTGNSTASIKAGTKVHVGETVVTFASDTGITMPALTAGTDYAIWVKDNATILATTDFSSAPDAGNWRKIGGFHYAPGGNAAAMAGGDATPAINAYSFWDLKFRPACPDPRGMTLVADSFWADIYLLGVNHLTDGTSKYNVSIADGSTPPKIPTKFGGTGSNYYSTFNWWEANEVLQSWGKRSPTYVEFAALAYGTTEATSSGGSDVPTTGVSGTWATNAWNKFTSRWGVIQATGCMWIWCGEFGGGAAGASWEANTGGRGSTYQMENAPFLGGSWGNATESGSRCSNWYAPPPVSANTIGARGVCGHYVAN